MALYDNKKKTIFRFPPFLTYIRYAHVFLLVVFYIEYRVLQSIYEEAWPWDGTDEAPTKWCEEKVMDAFARQPTDAFWSFSLCCAALFLSYCSCHDIWLSTEGRKPKNQITASPIISLSFALLTLFLFLMTLTSHACGCWGGEVWARAATDAVVAWPGFYIFWVWHNQRAGVSGSRGTLLPRWIFMVFAAVSMGSFFLYEYFFAWLGVGALYIVPAAAMTAYANWHWIQNTQEEHDNRVLRLAAIVFGVGYLCRLIDSWNIMCSPTSVFQFVSVWHVCLAVSICLQYLHLRAHHYRNVAASFSAPEGILGDVSNTGPRNKFT